MLASKRNGTLYTGVTSDLIRRIWEHKNDLVVGFSKRYGIHMLVWYEQHETMDSAIAREKAIKEWKRKWKLELIEKENPEWKDLYDDLLGLDAGLRTSGMTAEEELANRRHSGKSVEPESSLSASLDSGFHRSDDSKLVRS